MPEAELDALRRIYTAIQRGDTEELSRSVAHDVEWILPETVPWGGTRHGHLGVETVGEIFQEHVDGLWADPDDFLEAGDRIVVLGRISGRGRESGRDFEVRFAHVWAFDDGAPVRFRGYFDTAPIMAALEPS